MKIVKSKTLLGHNGHCTLKLSEGENDRHSYERRLSTIKRKSSNVTKSNGEDLRRKDID